MKKSLTLLLSVMALASQSVAAYNIYISNQTGWDQVALYAWGDGLTDPLGGWPGLDASSTKTINNVAYDVFAVPASLNGKSMNLIYNNHDNGSQLKDFYTTVDKDLYLAAWSTGLVAVNPDEGITPPDVKYNKLYVEDNSGWSDLHVYAWASEQPELFGGWPGAAASGTESLDGVTYSVFDMQDGTVAYNLIFNGDGKQFDGPSLVPDADAFVRITADSYQLLNDPRVTYCTIYVENKTGWDDFHIYAYADDQPELFGSWPGATASGTATVEGVDYLTFPVKSCDIPYNLIFNGSNKQYDAFQITPNRDYYIIANADSASEVGQTGIESVNADSGDAPVYYDMRGIRVDNPSAGLFIEVRGSDARKVIL